MVRKPIAGISSGTDTVVEITLPNDFGTNLTFTGNMVGEEMYFNDDTGMLTMEKLYRNDEEQRYAYGITSAIGHSRERRCYTVTPGEEYTRVDNGQMELDMPTDLLFELLTIAVNSENASEAQASEHVRRKLAVNE